MLRNGLRVMSWFVACAALGWTHGASAQDAAPRDTSASEQPVALTLPIEAGGWTADRAAASAVAVAPRVRQANLDRAQARATADSAMTAFIPRLDLRASYTRLSNITLPSFEIGGVAVSFTQILDQYSTRASVTVPVSAYFLTILPSYQAAQHAADMTVYQVATEQAGVEITARNAFYGYTRALAGRLVAQTSVAQLQAHLVDLDALFAAGTTTKADLMQAKAQLAQANAELIAREGAVVAAGAALRSVLNLPTTEALPVGEDVFHAPIAPPVKIDELARKALQERPEITAMRLLIDARDASARAESGGQWPTLSLVGNADYNNPNARIIPQEARFKGSWDLGATLSWSPNDYVSRGVRADQATLEVRRARTDLEELERRVALEAAQAASNYEVAVTSLTSMQEAVDAANEAWNVRRDLLRAGEATSNEVLDAEAALHRAQLAQIDAYIAVRIAHAQITYVGGRAVSQR